MSTEIYQILMVLVILYMMPEIITLLKQRKEHKKELRYIYRFEFKGDEYTASCDFKDDHYSAEQIHRKLLKHATEVLKEEDEGRRIREYDILFTLISKV